MIIRHHPSFDTLLAHSSGSLDLARSVLIAAHVELCPACSQRLRLLDHLGGALLSRLEPAAMADGALERAIEGLDALHPPEPAAAAAKFDLPLSLTALEPYELGSWRWIGPGVHWRSTNVEAPNGARVFLLRSRPGARLPHHTHTGTELTMTLQGAYSHEGGRFAAGDLEEADGNTDHQPVVDDGETCICLVAMQGNLRLLGLTGRLLQPFVRL